MCEILLCYYEKENFFVDEYGEIVYDIFTLITPNDLYMFRHDSDKYNRFQFRSNHEVSVSIIVIPEGDICSLGNVPLLDLEDILQIRDETMYERLEEYERTRMANVTG